MQKEELVNQFAKQQKAIQYFENEGLKYAEQIISTAQKSYANGDMSYWSYISFLNQAIDIKKQKHRSSKRLQSKCYSNAISIFQ